ncbi:MAG: 16S rRNA (adenine(1518)-N(6)/adenine(1519)-N(6))-dimethyltransferase RsmA [Phycisphaerae bacterium]
MLDQAGLKPRHRFGQCFLFDQNLMQKVIGFAEIDPEQTVLEVGPGTGSLTEELLDHAARVVAVEIDHGLARVLRKRLGERESFQLLEQDVLAGKHEIAPEVLTAIGDDAQMVANLPYNIATPLIAQSLTLSWQAAVAGRQCPRITRMTVMIQREMADRLLTGPGTRDYGPVSVLTNLLGNAVPGPLAPASAFWPRPKVESQVVRIDFVPEKAAKVLDVQVLQQALSLAFGQRRKQIGTVAKRRGAAFSRELFTEALSEADISPTQRAEQVSPEQFRRLGNALARTAREST